MHMTPFSAESDMNPVLKSCPGTSPKTGVWRASIWLTLLMLITIQACSSGPDPEIITLTDEEARQDAAQIEQEISVTLPDDLDVSLWASQKLMADPVAIHLDNQGQALITVTRRSRGSEFDIRDVHSYWLQETIKLESVEDRREFLHRELDPSRSDENAGFLPDLNEDGSHDWRDLTVMKEEVYRITDESGDGLADRSQLVIRDFHEEVTDVAGGVLAHGDEIFLAVGPDLWRLRDTNGDGMADWKESISHGFNVHIGFSGHGMSGLVTGPDGRIYWGIGDMGMNAVDQDGKRWFYPHEGVIVRSEPDGSNFEVFASGLRNTHEFTFDKYGNLITVDNDGDHAGESERLVYLIDGSDSGWRINWQFGKYTDPDNNDYKVWMDEEYYKPRFEEQSAHILPPLANYVAGPAGMVYNPGTALNDRWKEHFFVMSFRGSVTNSPLYAFTLKPSGASFELDTDQEVARGILAVGIDFGPDGALYMADWVEGWLRTDQGRIWKMDDPDRADSPIRVETRQLLAEDFGSQTAEELMGLLGHEDMRVRQKAQFELARRDDTESLVAAALDDNRQLARIHGIWGLAQIGRRNADVMSRIEPLLEDADPEIRAQTARMLGDVRHAPSDRALIPLLRDEEPRVQFFAAEALGRIGSDLALEPIVEMLEENDDEDVYLRQAGAIALSRINNSRFMADLTEHPSRAVRVAAVVALKRMQDPSVARFLMDEDEYVVTNAARAISDDAYIDEALPELARLPEYSPFTNEPLLRRAINASLYMGRAEDAQRLADLAMDRRLDDNVRAEALLTLAGWENPSLFDRVTGRYRGEFSNQARDAVDALGPVVEQLLKEGPQVQIAAAEAAGSLKLEQAIPRLAELLESAPDVEVRTAALFSLADLDASSVDEHVYLALQSDVQEVRRQALMLIPELDLDDETRAELLSAALSGDSYELQQTAFQILGSLETPAAVSVLEQSLEQLLAGELNPEVHLDLLQAAEQTEDELLEPLLKRWYAGRSEDDPVDYYRETLYGGDSSEGRRIFYRDAAAQCIRCHAVGGEGGQGDVGPDLGRIGAVRSREELLESLVDPSASITPGFGAVTLVLEDGEVIRGLLEEETATHITVAEGGSSREITRSDVSERTNAPSAMPAMGDLLSRSQLRDLIAFITTLRGES